VAAACGGQITAWFFDTACQADIPMPDRPQGRALLAALADLHRRVSAVIAADAYRVLPRRQAGAGTGIPGCSPPGSRRSCSPIPASRSAHRRTTT